MTCRRRWRLSLLDIAQDFLLAHLQLRGVFADLVVFKGGTALRKLYAGASGRFSTDIDLAARAVDTDRQTVAAMNADEANVTLGPFTFTSTRRSTSTDHTSFMGHCQRCTATLATALRASIQSETSAIFQRCSQTSAD